MKNNENYIEIEKLLKRKKEFCQKWNLLEKSLKAKRKRSLNEIVFQSKEFKKLEKEETALTDEIEKLKYKVFMCDKKLLPLFEKEWEKKWMRVNKWQTKNK